MKQQFNLFIDECGSPKPNTKDKFPVFAVGGVLLKKSDEISIKKSIEKFKTTWGIPFDTPLHGNEIRSNNKNFAWLGLNPKRDLFMENLTNLIVQSPITVIACVVSREGYLNKYQPKYGDNTWEMMKSAFTILIERTTKYVMKKNGTLMIYYEKSGKSEEKLIKDYYEDIKNGRHNQFFDPSKTASYSPLNSEQLSSVLKGIEGKSKKRSELQLADLCLYPVAMSKHRPTDRAYQSLQKHGCLIDSKIEQSELNSIGIKYYRFD